MEYELIKDLPGFKSGGILTELAGGEWRYNKGVQCILVPFGYMAQFLLNMKNKTEWFRPIEENESEL